MNFKKENIMDIGILYLLYLFSNLLGVQDGFCSQDRALVSSQFEEIKFGLHSPSSSLL